MKKLGLIIQREYMSIVGRKSFLVMTLLVPLLMVACGALPVLLAYFNQDNGSVENVAVIDETGRFAKAITDDANYHFVPLAANAAGKTNPREFYDKSNGNVAAVVVIPRDVMDKGKVIRTEDGRLAILSFPPGEQMEWDREYVHQKTKEMRWFHVIAFCCKIEDEKKYIVELSDRNKSGRSYSYITGIF